MATKNNTTTTATITAGKTSADVKAEAAARKEAAVAAMQESAGNATATNTDSSTATNSNISTNTNTTNTTAETTNENTSRTYGGAGNGNFTSGGGGATTGESSYSATSNKYGEITVHYNEYGNMDYFTDANGNTYDSSALDNGTMVHAANGKDYQYAAGNGTTAASADTASTDSTPTYSGTERDYEPSERPDYGLPTTQETYDAQKEMLDAWRDASNKQAVNDIDYSTQQSIIDYQRTLQDANDSYASELASIAKDEKNAQDNSALYAELRGDQGGIGQAQYNEIAATAMQNRQAVQTAQNELATDTQRAITDLRAQGEYEKADKLLEISQSYLSQLMSIYQWAVEYGLSEAEFEESIREWQDNFNESVYEFDANLQYNYDSLNESVREFEKNFSLNEAEVTGYYNGNPTYERESDTTSTLASAGASLLSAGIIPSDEQLEAMGMTLAEAQAYITAQTTTTSGSGSGGGNPTGDNTLTAAIASLDSLIASGSINSYDEAYAYLKDSGISVADIQNAIGKSDDWSGYKTQTLAHASYVNSVNTIVSDISTPLSQYINVLVDQTKSYGENYGGASGIIAKAQQWAATYALQHNGNESLVEDAISNIDWTSLQSQVSEALQ